MVRGGDNSSHRVTSLSQTEVRGIIRRGPPASVCTGFRPSDVPDTGPFSRSNRAAQNSSAVLSVGGCGSALFLEFPLPARAFSRCRAADIRRRRRNGMDSLADALLNGAGAETLERAPLPEDYLAVHTRREDVDMFGDDADKDVRRSLHVGRVPMPELAPDEVLVAVMASSINYNTVWSATFEPVSTFGFLQKLGAQGGWAERHDQPYHVLGSGRRRRHRPGGRRGAPLAGRRPCHRQLRAGRRPGAGHPRRRHARRRAAYLGIRDQLRRARPLHRRTGQSVAHQAHPSDVGGVGEHDADRRHRLPHADQRPRRPHQAGRHRSDLGRHRRTRWLRRPVGQERRWHPGRRSQLRGQGPAAARTRLRRHH